jgi:hypothetical protein
MVGPAALETGGNLPGGTRAKVLERFGGDEGGVRRDDHPGVVVGRGAQIWRLGVLHVEGGASQPARG